MKALFALSALLMVACSMPDTPFTPLQWQDLTSRPQPLPDATYAYGTDAMQKVDVWLPKGASPFPVVLMVHGGCWTTHIADRKLMNWVAGDLRDHGVAVWNIDYRGVDRAGGGYPGTFLDTAAAADALRDQAGRYHLDLRHVVAVGHSAGGHLALWLAARARIASGPLRSAHPLKIDHVVSLGGLPDLAKTATEANGCGNDVVGQLVGTGRANPYADTSVTRLLPIGVPADLVNGEQDQIIPVPFASDYVAKARKAGDAVALHMVDRTGHVELITPDSAAWAEARGLILRALKK